MMGMLEYIHETPAAVRYIVSGKIFFFVMLCMKQKEERYMKSSCAAPVQVITQLYQLPAPCRRYWVSV